MIEQYADVTGSIIETASTYILHYMKTICAIIKITHKFMFQLQTHENFAYFSFMARETEVMIKVLLLGLLIVPMLAKILYCGWKSDQFIQVGKIVQH